MGDSDNISGLNMADLKVEDPTGLYQIEQYRICDSLGYLLKRTMAMLSTALDQELARYDLTHPQYSILMILSERQGYTAADIARETGTDTGAVTRMLDRLEAKTLVQRTRSSDDRRVVNIELTAAGGLVAQKVPVLAINVLNRHLVGFDSDELEIMKGFLRRLLGNGGVSIPAVNNQPTDNDHSGD